MIPSQGQSPNSSCWSPGVNIIQTFLGSGDIKATSQGQTQWPWALSPVQMPRRNSNEPSLTVTSSKVKRLELCPNPETFYHMSIPPMLPQSPHIPTSDLHCVFHKDSQFPRKLKCTLRPVNMPQVSPSPTCGSLCKACTTVKTWALAASTTLPSGHSSQLRDYQGNPSSRRWVWKPTPWVERPYIIWK